MTRFAFGPAWIVGSLLWLSLCGCRADSTKEARGSSSGQPPARATVVQPERKPLVRSVELPGRVEAFETTPLHTKATGYVTAIPVDVGDVIRGPKGDEPGTLLCELRAPELGEELARKSAAVAQAQAEVAQADAQVKVFEAAVQSARAKIVEAEAVVEREESQFVRWQSEFQRVSQLAEAGAVTKKVAEETRAQWDAAAAARKAARARIASLEAQQQEAEAELAKSRADAVVARSKVTVAEADQRQAAALADYAILRAPYDGIVVERNVHTGYLAQAGTGAAPPLLVVMRTDPVRVIVDVPEVDAVRLTPTSKVELRIPSLPGSSYVGTMTRSTWSLHPTTRTMAAQIHLPNASGQWRPGQYVQAKLTSVESDDCLSLPKSAIVTQEKQTYCFCVDRDGIVRRLPVTIGLQAGTDVEILAGLSGDERVISVNASAFREGQIVAVATPPNSR